MSNSKTTPKERATRFVGSLRRLRNDRGKLAALRRGLSPSTVMDAWPVVAAMGGQIGQPGESAFVDIAALYASHPEESNARNFGETCRRIAQGESKDVPESFERRFRRLLVCGDAGDLAGQLRSWIRLAASKGVGVNYEGLFADLLNWPWYADEIRVKWARSFWQSGEAQAETTTEPSSAANA